MSYGFYDITLYGINDRNFACRNNLVSSLYVYFLEGYKPKGTTRISANIANEDDIKSHFGSILLAEAVFDIREYQISSPELKNLIILNTIHRIAILSADKFGWDKSIFEHAYKKVIGCNFIYKKEFKLKLSKDRNHNAALLLEKNGEVATISVNFYNKQKEIIKSRELLKTFDHEMFYGRLVLNNKWFNNSQFGVENKTGELTIKASIENDLIENLITPITKTQEELEGYLNGIIYKD